MSDARTGAFPVSVGVRAFLVLLASISVVLLSGAVKPVALLIPGSQSPARAMVEQDFGVVRTHGNLTGYDGEQYYSIARFFPDLVAAKPFLAFPAYSEGRIVQPALASLAGPGTPIVLMFLLLGLFGTALACASIGDLASLAGMNPRSGYAAAIVLMPIVLASGVEPLAYGLALFAMCLVERRRIPLAILIFSIAALTRETATVLALASGVALFARYRTQRSALQACALFGIPLVLWGAWQTTVRHIIDDSVAPPTGAVPFELLRTDPLYGLIALGLGLTGLLAVRMWRPVPAPALLCLLCSVWIAVFAPSTSDWLTFPRVWAPLFCLLLAGVAGRLMSKSGVRASKTPAPAG